MKIDTLIDKSKLNLEYPISGLKKYTDLNEEDIYYLFMECSLSPRIINDFIGLPESSGMVQKLAQKKGWVKTVEQRNKTREITCRYLYGVNNISELKDIKDRKEQTSLKNYGVKTYLQSSEFKEWFKDYEERTYGGHFSSTEEGKEIIKNRIINKYGVSNISLLPDVMRKKAEKLPDSRRKAIDTFNKNKTFNSSKPEELIYSLLSNTFSDVKRQYFDQERYPFACDFYIPSLDLFIEYNGTWTHGGEFFNEHNKEHIIKLNEWKEEGTDFYKNAIYVWTDLDVRKRTIAEQNELNYLAFFNLSQFFNWYSQFLRKDELLGSKNSELVNFCLNTEFPGSYKYPPTHPIWDCYVANKVSPRKAWENPNLLLKAINNLIYMFNSSIEQNKYLDFISKIIKAKEGNGIELAREILLRFTVAKIAPKVTALQATDFERIIKESKVDIRNGIYCPMAGFGGIVEGAKRYFNKRGISAEIEAYDINEDLCNYFGWEKRNLLEQVIKTHKVVVACPPFGKNTERWPGTPDSMYYDFKEWCKLIKKYIIAPNYILIGPEISSKRGCGLFSKKQGIQWYPEYTIR